MRLETMTAREREVMTFVVKDLLNKQIALKVHRTPVMKKIAAQSFRTGAHCRTYGFGRT
jgi:FixJ family two-component response regulator